MDIKNKLSDDNIEKILNSVRFKTDQPYFSTYVDTDEIVNKEYNLSVNTYLEAENIQEVVDIKVLNQEIEEIVKNTDRLRKAIDEIIIDLEGSN
jgi:type I restriction enzyme M protein